ncbi:MAG: hypothetical protein GWN77_09605, partial [Gammaproteobacteria bacterium]|nr:hypothetical protein [Gammaproteobacteria bacterium]
TFRGNVHQPAISPDGQHIAYVEAGEDDLSRVIMVQDLAGGAPVKVFEDETIFGIRWSPDGSELLTFAYNDTVPGIVLVPRAGGSVRRYRISGHPFAWSPDGDRFALHDYLRDRVLFVDKISGDTLPGSFEAMVWDMEWSPDGQLLALAEYTDTDPFLTLYSLADSSKIRSDFPVNVERV